MIYLNRIFYRKKTENTDCDVGGKGCINSGTKTKLYGSLECNTCEMQDKRYNSATYIIYYKIK